MRARARARAFLLTLYYAKMEEQTYSQHVEEWKIAPSPFSLYAVSTDGHLKRISTGHILAENVSKTGYVYAKVDTRNGRKSKRIHRIVALTYIPNPHKKAEVNHKDGNRQNNSVSNLEWVTRTENMRDATKRKRDKKRKLDDAMWWGYLFF